ncbi:MAG TPA: class I SAM-dependent methyltransferase, partial [Pseudomonadales bacterium]
EVASFYVHRPEYPQRIFEQLVELSPHRHGLLDLGCGTGKIARALAGSFASVTAVDASKEMLRVAATLQREETRNIRWIHGLAEAADLEGAPFDLVVAAASIHWMDHPVLFPRLASVVHAEHVFAVVDGDGAFEPPWQSEWDEFLQRWIYALTGESYEPARTDGPFMIRMTQYKDWIHVAGETDVMSEPIVQIVDDFVACQHSRDTFAPSKLGALRGQFDVELASLLAPYATDGSIRYRVRTRLTWGSIKA